MRKLILLAALSIMSLNLSGCGGYVSQAKVDAFNRCIGHGGG